jgi:hypothetical protein
MKQANIQLAAALLAAAATAYATGDEEHALSQGDSIVVAEDAAPSPESLVIAELSRI